MKQYPNENAPDLVALFDRMTIAEVDTLLATCPVAPARVVRHVRHDVLNRIRAEAHGKTLVARRIPARRAACCAAACAVVVGTVGLIASPSDAAREFRTFVAEEWKGPIPSLPTGAASGNSSIRCMCERFRLCGNCWPKTVPAPTGKHFWQDQTILRTLVQK